MTTASSLTCYLQHYLPEEILKQRVLQEVYQRYDLQFLTALMILLTSRVERRSKPTEWTRYLEPLLRYSEKDCSYTLRGEEVSAQASLRETYTPRSDYYVSLSLKIIRDLSVRYQTDRQLRSQAQSVFGTYQAFYHRLGLIYEEKLWDTPNSIPEALEILQNLTDEKQSHTPWIESVKYFLKALEPYDLNSNLEHVPFLKLVILKHLRTCDQNRWRLTNRWRSDQNHWVMKSTEPDEFEKEERRFGADVENLLQSYQRICESIPSTYLHCERIYRESVPSNVVDSLLRVYNQFNLPHIKCIKKYLETQEEREWNEHKYQFQMMNFLDDEVIRKHVCTNTVKLAIQNLRESFVEALDSFDTPNFGSRVHDALLKANFTYNIMEGITADISNSVIKTCTYIMRFDQALLYEYSDAKSLMESWSKFQNEFSALQQQEFYVFDEDFTRDKFFTSILSEEDIKKERMRCPWVVTSTIMSQTELNIQYYLSTRSSQLTDANRKWDFSRFSITEGFDPNIKIAKFIHFELEKLKRIRGQLANISRRKITRTKFNDFVCKGLQNATRDFTRLRGLLMTKLQGSTYTIEELQHLRDKAAGLTNDLNQLFRTIGKLLGEYKGADFSLAFGDTKCYNTIASIENNFRESTKEKMYPLKEETLNVSSIESAGSTAVLLDEY